MSGITVLKLGGELLDDDTALKAVAAAIVRLSAGGPLVVVHGGGRAIDGELRARGRSPVFADGLRVTDAAALEAVVDVLAGRTNTALVAAVGAAGGRGVGLTGADGRIGLATLARPHRTVDGLTVDLGLVGEPDAAEASLLLDLVRLRCIPIVASLGVDREGRLLNVNADVLAAHLAAIIGASRLIVAGTTAGVLDREGRTIATVAAEDIEEMAAAGAAHSGMIAKLLACRSALDRGVGEVAIVSGRTAGPLEQAPGTRLTYRGSTTPSQAEITA
ncbi:MAG TPA: acetylglutamate kinase [Vicinamibacterales bacterium]|nr:acetylglutamate kinase [Vicinamibacterales bacterium]